ncbi:hypothetical protein HY991_02065 [Candidatus Micrarchaeota archaeon]|nr:hypothetical protein [Candidatus Micrarchaeota archaeon]
MKETARELCRMRGLKFGLQRGPLKTSWTLDIVIEARPNEINKRQLLEKAGIALKKAGLKAHLVEESPEGIPPKLVLREKDHRLMDKEKLIRFSELVGELRRRLRLKEEVVP